MTGYDALRQSAAWLNLSARGKLRVSGEDRARLLHAMCTNHVQDLQAGDGLYAFFLSAQGRILADAYVYNLGDTFFLDTEPETAVKLREHLDRYIIADDVTIEDEAAQWYELAIEGPTSQEAGSRLGITLPEKSYCLQQWDGGFVVRVSSTGSLGFRIFAPKSDEKKLIRRLTELEIPEADGADARTVRIENGKPRYGEDITERYLVQETQELQGVHPNKGCYLGQEIVERVRSRGQVHRLLTPIRIKSKTVPAPGTKLSLDGKDVAEVTSAVESPAFHEVAALGYVRAEVLQRRPILVVSGAEPMVTAYIPPASS